MAAGYGRAYLGQEPSHVLSCQAHQQQHTAQVGLLHADVCLVDCGCLLHLWGSQRIPICLQDSGDVVPLCRQQAKIISNHLRSSHLNID